VAVARRKRTYPWLADDVRRAWGVSLLGIPFAVLLVFAIVRALTEDGTISRISAQDFTILLTLAIVAELSVLMIAVTALTYVRADAATLRRWLRETTPPPGWRRIIWGMNGGGAIYWASSGTIVALSSMLYLAISDLSRLGPWAIGGGVAVVASTFAVIVVAYAVRYAREDATADALQFPGTERPRFADYVYFAIQVSTTFGGSDVQILTTSMRRVVAVHSVLAWTFNTVIVAVLVSVVLNSVA
jgi:hypothetical protein